MKELKKLAIILRALGFKVNVENETISFGDGAVYDNIFAAVDLANCHWDIWHEGRTFEVHFFANNECIYDHFNSIKVRLEQAITYSLAALAFVFQFHKGTIRTSDVL